ncbi:hypothetical protein MSAN_02356300 [Mycena sanguinolenta]|uniref:Uncharacterized protein n=1 Tax=Mycena sanguinolenta TaxID=230812 RepID=A0A8H7CEQ8_9AGAR|nr:hypothetical protein MSAN_02356300 [Mycena sanguinolenta]
MPRRKLLRNEHERTREGGAKTEAYGGALIADLGTVRIFVVVSPLYSARASTFLTLPRPYLITLSLCQTQPAIPLQRHTISDHDAVSTSSDLVAHRRGGRSPASASLPSPPY